MSQQKQPPALGWIEVSDTTASYLRAAGLDGIAVVTDPPTDPRGTKFAPAWAEAIISVEDVSHRIKMCALKKAARDPGTAMTVAALVACIDRDDRRELVENLGAEFAQTIVCACGGKFDNASDWREHVEFVCPKRNKALNKL